MAKLRIISDVHLEFGPLNLDPIGEDVLVLAGDIGLHMQGALWGRYYALRTGIPVVMIAGNHEFYRTSGAEYTIGSTLTALRSVTSSYTRPFHFLERDRANIGGIVFLGTTLWTDYALDGDPIIGRLNARQCMNDHRKIYDGDKPFTPETAAQLHGLSIDWLVDNFVPGAVVITHHLPSRRSIAHEYATDPLNCAYASNLDTFVADTGAALWIHGHVHASQDYMLGGTRVICNPRGYWPDGLNPDFDPNLIVEV
jgi:predicted phosphodiesterase